MWIRLLEIRKLIRNMETAKELVMEIHGIDLQEQLLACRVCLATDTKLFHLPTHPIAQTYALLTGTALSLTDGQPQHICTVCSSLLLKYSALRAKCRTAEIILQVAHAENQLVTTDYLRNLDRTHLKHNLFLTLTQNIEVIPKKTSGNHSRKISKPTQQFDLKIHDDMLPEDHPMIDNDDKTFGCVAENIGYTSIKSDDISSDIDIDESLLPDCLIEIANDVFKDSKEEFKEIKSEITKIDIKPEPKEEDSVISKTTTKKTKTSTKKTKTTTQKTKTTTKKKNIERPVTRQSVKRVEQKRKINRQVRKKNQENITNKGGQLAEISKKYNIDIVILSKEEQRKQIEARKETENYKNSQFKCDICFKGFVEESQFTSHMAVHDATIRKHVCDICRCCFTSKRYLSGHIRCHSMNITCKECNHVLKDISEAKQHFDWHQGVTFDCEQCGKSFMKIKSKVNHCRIHHGYTPCPICGDCFVGQAGIKAHMIKSHKEAVDAVCSTCNVQFHCVEALSKHACESGILPCPQCGDSFSTEEALKDHRRVHRKRRIYKQKIKIEIKCLQCGEPFTSEKLHKMHLNHVHNIKSSSTTQRRQNAGKTGNFKNKDAYNICICDICGSFMPSQAALREHQRIHTGEKPYQCGYCPKTFRQKVQLQHHTYTHTDEKPYKCPECPKAFSQPRNRDRHLLVHTKERPYICQLCGRTFQQSSYVKIHMRTAHMKEAWPKRIRPSRIKQL